MISEFSITTRKYIRQLTYKKKFILAHGSGIAVQNSIASFFGYPIIKEMCGEANYSPYELESQEKIGGDTADA